MKAGMESGMDKAVCLKGLKLGPETNWEHLKKMLNLIGG